MSHGVQALRNRNVRINRPAQTMKTEKLLVMIILTRSKYMANIIWKDILADKPPKMAAVILTNLCHLEVLRYFGLAGMVKKL